MADTQSYLPAQHLYIRQILQESQHRWLRPAEICEILRNYQNFNLTPEPPTRPPAGSVFLFNRKALRYFRKDGHRWRKKKDGKTVKEAHEKLKAGSVDVLHCYYAHGEDNESFQRRSYWMLDGHLEHIVLVHYREVKEGHKATISRLLEDERPHTVSHHKNSLANSSASTIQTSYAPTANRHNWSGQAISPELEDVKSLGSLGEFNQPKSVCHQTSHDASFLVNHRAEPSTHHLSWFIGGSNEVNDVAPLLAEVQTTNTDSKHEQKLFCHKSNITGVIDTSQSQNLTEVRLESDGEVLDMNTGNRLVPSSELQAVATVSEAPTGEGNSTTPCSPMITSSTTQTESKCNRLNNEGNGELKKLDSFGRWMVKEIGRDCDDSLIASDSGNCWNNLSAENDDREVSSFSRHMHFDIDSPGPSLSQQQLFSINDFSPEWAYSKIETKVLIIGKFFQTKNITKWSCMFGEIEVSAEILTDTSIRCVAPPHAPGRVPFYVTCSNRLACSEVREFEYREMPLTLNSDPQYELHLQVQLAKLLHLGVAEQSLDCSNQKCDKCKLKRSMYSTRVVPESEEVRTDKEASILEHMCSTNSVLQSLLKDKLYRWLVYKIHEKEVKGPQVLDEKGQGVLHLVASLGYEWAVGPIIAAGVNPNFRDVCGRTALHWASYFGREETVITLLRFGADTSLVDDPKPEFPGGQTAADLASRRGHKGIAAYLAEVDLTSRLSSLTVEHNLVDSADEVASVTCSKDEEDLSMKRSLAAIRKSARAAALIQFVFRARSFRQRQWTSSGNGGSEASSTDLVALGSLTRVKKVSCYDDYLHSAAIRIQQKYRGWKGRKEFLKIRNRIVKVQACVRGHQVRRQHKKFVWSVSIMEKVILRWRRKRVGLRGFRVENNTILEDSEFDGVERGDEYDFLRIGRKQKVDGVERALARVKSLVRDPKARDQYMRLATGFDNCKIVQDGESAS